MYNYFREKSKIMYYFCDQSTRYGFRKCRKSKRPLSILRPPPVGSIWRHKDYPQLKARVLKTFVRPKAMLDPAVGKAYPYKCQPHVCLGSAMDGVPDDKIISVYGIFIDVFYQQWEMVNLPITFQITTKA